LDMPREPAALAGAAQPPNFSPSNFLVSEIPGLPQAPTLVSQRGNTQGVVLNTTFPSERYRYEYDVVYNTSKIVNYAALVQLASLRTTLTANSVPITVPNCNISSSVVIRGVGTADCSNYSVFYGLNGPTTGPVSVTAIRIRIGAGQPISPANLAIPNSYS